MVFIDFLSFGHLDLLASFGQVLHYCGESTENSNFGYFYETRSSSIELVVTFPHALIIAFAAKWLTLTRCLHGSFRGDTHLSLMPLIAFTH